MSFVIDFETLRNLKRKYSLIPSQSEFANTCIAYKMRILSPLITTALRAVFPEADPEMRILKQVFS